MPDRRTAQEALQRLTVDVADWPEKGVTFKDITPVLADHHAFSAIITALAAAGRDDHGTVVVDKVVGMEARGFILAAPVALALGIGFVPVRKAGKLPRAAHAVSYALEYGEATLEVHKRRDRPGRARPHGRRRAGDRRHRGRDAAARSRPAAASRPAPRS